MTFNAFQNEVGQLGEDNVKKEVQTYILELYKPYNIWVYISITLSGGWTKWPQWGCINILFYTRKSYNGFVMETGFSNGTPGHLSDKKYRENRE